MKLVLEQRPPLPSVQDFDDNSASPVGEMLLLELVRYLAPVQHERARLIGARLPSTKLAMIERDILSEVRSRGVVFSGVSYSQFHYEPPMRQRQQAKHNVPTPPC